MDENQAYIDKINREAEEAFLELAAIADYDCRADFAAMDKEAEENLARFRKASGGVLEQLLNS